MVDGAAYEDGTVGELGKLEGGEGEEMTLVADGPVEGEERPDGCHGDVGRGREERGKGEGGGDSVVEIGTDIVAGYVDSVVGMGREAAGEGREEGEGAREGAVPPAQSSRISPLLTPAMLP